MNTNITIQDVANIFLGYESMTNRKLQSLCYYAQAHHLGLNKTPLINDCRFEAWIQGPTSPDLFHKHKANGAQPIIKQDIIFNNITDNYHNDFLESIYNVYGHLTEDDLKLLTCSEMPWRNARAHLKKWEHSRIRISEEDMIEYYDRK